MGFNQIIKPQVIICHGRRAMQFCVYIHSNAYLVGVAHNYNIKCLKKCDYVIATTSHMKQYLIDNKIVRDKIHVIPNMLDIANNTKKNIGYYHNPVVIGVIARFVKKKGLDVFLQALNILEIQGYEFQAIIGGDGEEKDHLIRLSKTLELKNKLQFIGWVEDKNAFFNSIDIFCLPSLEEPFGIVLLEAMSYHLPIVATNTTGPNEILRSQQDGILCEIGEPKSLATAITFLIDNKQQAQQYAESAYNRLVSNYTIDNVSDKLLNFLNLYCK